jgi:glycosyltransferase involved in cell wall biosynthesis
VIPIYNGCAYIVAALQSLVAQTRRDFEIIVIDDGSTDGSIDLVRAFAASTAADDPAIRVIRQDNAGVSAARNRGIAAARADYVGFLDADDLWAREKVAHHVGLMAAHPAIDLTFSGFDHIDAAGRNLSAGLVPTEGALRLERLMTRNVIHSSAVIARREAVVAAGGFDPALSFYEDVDLWLRVAALRPDNLHAIAQPLASYRRHPSQTTRNWRKIEDGWHGFTAGLAARHPDEWARVKRNAYLHHREYCASLAYDAGDLSQARAIVAGLWRHAGAGLFARKDSLIMTAACLVSYLPDRPRGAVRAMVSLCRTLSRRLRTRRWPGATARRGLARRAR